MGQPPCCTRYRHDRMPEWTLLVFEYWGIFYIDYSMGAYTLQVEHS